MGIESRPRSQTAKREKLQAHYLWPGLAISAVALSLAIGLDGYPLGVEPMPYFSEFGDYALVGILASLGLIALTGIARHVLLRVDLAEVGGRKMRLGIGELIQLYFPYPRQYL